MLKDRLYSSLNSELNNSGRGSTLKVISIVKRSLKSTISFFMVSLFHLIILRIPFLSTVIGSPYFSLNFVNFQHSRILPSIPRFQHMSFPQVFLDVHPSFHYRTHVLFCDEIYYPKSSFLSYLSIQKFFNSVSTLMYVGRTQPGKSMTMFLYGL